MWSETFPVEPVTTPSIISLDPEVQLYITAFRCGGESLKFSRGKAFSGGIKLLFKAYERIQIQVVVLSQMEMLSQPRNLSLRKMETLQAPQVHLTWLPGRYSQQLHSLCKHFPEVVTVGVWSKGREDPTADLQENL